MKAIVILALLFCSSAASAESTLPREMLIDQIEATYMQSVMLSSDSPFLTVILSTAKAQNPNVSAEQWEGIKRELAPALSKVLTGKGGMLDYTLRKSFAIFSDDELVRLSQILDDPIYRKLQTALNNPSTQMEMAKMLFSSAAKMNGAINDILVKHGLNAVN
jgi:hypothetical protein